MGMFLDESGTDTYYADGRAMGSSLLQGAGWFLELAGEDRYPAKHPEVVGAPYQRARGFGFVEPGNGSSWRAAVPGVALCVDLEQRERSEEHTSELQSP